MGADWAKEKIGVELDTAKAKTVQLRKKLVRNGRWCLIWKRRKRCRTNIPFKSCVMNGDSVLKSTRGALRRRAARWSSA